MSVLTSLPEWKKLSKIAETVKSAHMRDWFASDNERAEKMTLNACGIYLDYSKNRVNDDALSSLFDLARACDLKTIRTSMFEGEHINTTEGRAVLHTALRNFSDRPVMVDGEDVMPEVHATLEKMKGFTESIHSGEHKGYTGKPVKHIVARRLSLTLLTPLKYTSLLTLMAVTFTTCSQV